MAADSPATRQAGPVAGQTAVSVEPLGAVARRDLRRGGKEPLRKTLGDTRLVAEYLGQADLSTVSRYAHVAREELFAAAGCLENLATHDATAA